MGKQYKQLLELGEIITGKTPSTANNELWGGNIPFITPTDINGYTTFYQTETERTVSEIVASNVRFIESQSMGTLAAITSAKDAVLSVNSLYGLDHEELWVLFLNSKNKPLECKRMTSGGWTSTVIDNRQILREALMLRSSGLILFHNHPSGDPTPGIEDIKQTEKLKDASDLLDITLIDHIIVGDQSYFSFAENKETCK